MYEKLKAVLKEKGVTAYRLAKESSIAAPDLYNALHGYKPLYPNWRKRIAEALNMTEHELFEEG